MSEKEQISQEQKSGASGSAVKNFFGFVFSIIAGVGIGAIYAIIGFLLAVLLVGVLAALVVFLTAIYGFLAGILVALAILIVVICVAGGFILGFLPENFLKEVRKKIEEEK